MLGMVALSPRWGGRLVWLTWPVLMFIELDRIISIFLMGQDPLFYDQLFLLRHFVVLLSDLWSTTWTLGLLGLIAIGIASAWLLKRVVTVLRDRLPQKQRQTRIALGVALAITAVHGIALPDARPMVRWISVELLDNVVRSVGVWRGISTISERSPYTTHTTTSLTRRPDVHFYIVESYGRILTEERMQSRPYRARMDVLENTLLEDGWHSVTGYSTAPVSGGRSWLADASVVMGMPIRYESVYQQLLGHVGQIPDMIDFFEHNDYRTIRMAPKDRARPGIEMTNDLHFGETVAFAELDYSGPAMGWGWIPDQFSLGYASENLLDGPPLFLFMHMVTSHAPWQTPPPILDDWQALELLAGEASVEDNDAASVALRKFDHFARPEEVRIRRSRADAFTVQGYADAIDYDLEVLRRHLRDFPQRDALIIIMGDHQPPLVSRRYSMDVPVHVLSRDASMLAEWQDQGFSPGMLPPAFTKPAVRHEGLLSLTVRALARCCSTVRPLPEMLPEGVQPHP